MNISNAAILSREIAEKHDAIGRARNLSGVAASERRAFRNPLPRDSRLPALGTRRCAGAGRTRDQNKGLYFQREYEQALVSFNKRLPKIIQKCLEKKMSTLSGPPMLCCLRIHFLSGWRVPIHCRSFLSSKETNNWDRYRYSPHKP